MLGFADAMRKLLGASSFDGKLKDVDKDFGLGDVHVATALGNGKKPRRKLKAKLTSRSSRSRKPARAPGHISFTQALGKVGPVDESRDTRGKWTTDGGGLAVNAQLGASIKIAGTPSPSFVKKVEDGFSGMPADVRQMLIEDRVGIVAADKFSSAYPMMVGQHPVGWPAGATVDDLSGGYNPRSNELVFAERGIAFNPSSPDSVLYHESGHAIDNVLGLSKDPAIRDAYIMDSQNLGPGASKALDYFLQSATGTKETVAELFANSYNRTTGTPSNMPLARWFPRTSAALADRLQASLPSFRKPV